MLEQLGGRPGCTAGVGEPSGRVECLGRLGVGGVDGQSDVPGATLGVLNELGQGTVHRPSLFRRGERVHARGEQRVHVDDAAVLDADDPGFDRRGQVTAS